MIVRQPPQRSPQAVQKAQQPAPQKVVRAIEPVDNQAPLQFDPEHAKVVTLHCSDGRFTHHVEALMKAAGVSKYDILSMPGGPALLDMSSATILEAEATRAGMSFLIRGHGIQQVYLIAHTGCGFYKNRFAGQPQEVIETKQSRDLQAAAAWLRKSHPTVKTYAYLAMPENNTVSFKAIELDDKTNLLLL